MHGFKLSLFGFLCAAMVAHSPLPAMAQQWGGTVDLSFNNQMNRYTESEKVGFAFYRLTSTLPDFRDWITPSDIYKNAKSSHRPDVMQQEISRLQQGFLNFYADQTPLTIRTAATVQLQETPTEKSLNITLTNAPNPLYFPFNVGELGLGLILNGIDQSMNIPVSAAEYEHIKLLLRVRDPEQMTPVQLELIAFANTADSHEPLVADNLVMFPVLAEPVVTALWKVGDTPVLLWERVTEGYATNRQQELTILLNKE